jgi:hypothetical protein
MIENKSETKIQIDSLLAGPATGSYYIGQEIDWQAPWIEVNLWVELPFWLMTGNTTITVTLEGHDFGVAIEENYFELHVGMLSDSKDNVVYRGPRKPNDELSQEIQDFSKSRPDVPLMWRKCKTILKIKSRCNEHVWNFTQERDITKKNSIAHRAAMNGVRLYLATLCRAHIPMVNKVVQTYRLATYDYFPHEVSPWDVPHWVVERDAKTVRSSLVPYREWNFKPMVFDRPSGEPIEKLLAGQVIEPPTLTYKLIEEGEFQSAGSIVPTDGELEVLDALNLMERGDYSGAVRRITTALEVVVESVVGEAVEKAEGKRNAVQFLKNTETNFRRRVEKYEQISGRVLPDSFRTEIFATRKLRHKIVHRGYRIGPNERGRAQQAVDKGRWTFNWFENNGTRRELREKRIAFRSLGRELMIGIFPSSVTPDGVVIEQFPKGPKQKDPK